VVCLNKNYYFYKIYSMGLYEYTFIFDKKGNFLGSLTPDHTKVLENIFFYKKIKNNDLEYLLKKNIITYKKKCSCNNWFDAKNKKTLKTKNAKDFIQKLYLFFLDIFTEGSVEIDTYNLFWEHIEPLLPKTTGKVLDAGCGSGFYSQKLADIGFKVYSIDLAPERFNANHKNIIKLSADLEQIPFKDNSFDLILNLFVLEHVSNLELVVKELMRVLKPKGKLIVAIPVISLKQIIYEITHKNIINLLDFEHVRAFTFIKEKPKWRVKINYLRKLFVKNNGKIISEKGVLNKKPKFTAFPKFFPFKYFGNQMIFVITKK